jgi:cytochrome c oxidase subunit IV
MSAKPLQASTNPGLEPKREKSIGLYRLVWICLPVMLALSALIVSLFGVSWWTALVVFLLLACPAAIAITIRVGRRQLPRYEDRDG